MTADDAGVDDTKVDGVADEAVDEQTTAVEDKQVVDDMTELEEETDALIPFESASRWPAEMVSASITSFLKRE